MAGDGFRVHQIDHVEVFVPDRREAARWYEEVLGLQILLLHEDWAEDPQGPLMISSDDGATMVALFQGDPPGTSLAVGHVRVAFRVDGPGFLQFLDRVPGLPLHDQQGNRAVPRVRDHHKAFSAYFCDPWGNRYEVTTYDHAAIADRMVGRTT
jgi:catechol 2,3-dioxygenase-like lactoylglutathione lyase family enzyme